MTPARLAEPRWIVSAAYAAIVTAVATFPSWPGYMSYDSLLAYEQTFTGVQTMTWPPMHTYLFQVSRSLGAGPWGLFLAQTFVLFFAAGAIINMLVAGRRLALAGLAGFALMFVAWPTLLSTLMAQWRDVPTASFTLLGLALWLEAARRRAAVWLVPAALSFGCAAALRYNAIGLIVAAAPLMVATPYLGAPAPARARVLAALALVIALAGAWGSTRWRLPDLKTFAPPSNFAGVQIFDLFGISACAGRDYIPGAVTEGATVTVAQIRRAYDPRHLNLTLKPKPGLPRFHPNDGHGSVAEHWRAAVAQEPGCYLRHRVEVMREQMGLGDGRVFYVAHGAIDANPYGVKLAHPAVEKAVRAYLVRNAEDSWRRAGYLYLLALLVLPAAAVARRDQALFLAAVFAGALGYAGTLFLAGPAADARYIFASNVLCALLIVTGDLAIVGRLRGR